MSADLWADFVASVEQGPSEPLTGVEYVSNDDTQHDLGGPDEDDFDDFGDFQDAGGRHVERIPSSKPLRAKQVIKRKSRETPPERSKDVLFDAEDPHELRDEVRDGEAQEPGVSGVSRIHSASDSTGMIVADLIDFEDNVELPRLAPQISSSIRPINSSAAPRQQPDRTGAKDEDEWDDFETVDPTTEDSKIIDATARINLPQHITTMMTASLPPSSTLQPPQSIPPPSILLALFPPLIDKVSQTFLRPINALSADEKHTFLTRPEVHAALQSYHALAVTLAHILAGRKHRWKRDRHLAQSMSIGPALSGRSGGMKLAGLDRSESAREDLAAQHVLAVWSAQAGRLRTVLAASPTELAPTVARLPPLPELGETMPVRVAKVRQGAVVALAPCALCGLKREERVGAKVDDGVEDMFDEWWLENPRMHASCWRFWDVQKHILRSR